MNREGQYISIERGEPLNRVLQERRLRVEAAKLASSAFPESEERADRALELAQNIVDVALSILAPVASAACTCPPPSFANEEHESNCPKAPKR